jgi:branched-chain amino acid transport system substrate-binding protein
MVPGQHHVRMNMFIGQVQGGLVKTIKPLGVIDPDEQIVPTAPLARV